MARLYAVEDSVVPVHDTFAEAVGNQNTYGVIAGCGVTLDAADLTYDVAAGAIMHNGVPVAVSAQTNAGTLVADSSNPRFTWIALDSTGTEVMVSGTAASDPAVPELGDYVPLMLVKVAAGGTIASSQTNYDQRIPLTRQVWRSTSNFTKNNNDTLGDVTGIKFHIGASEVWSFVAYLQASIGATPDIKVAFSVPASAAVTGNYVRYDAAGVAAARVSDFTASTAITTAAAGNQLVLTGTVVNSSTAGIVQLQAAQNTATVEDTIIYAQSFIVAHRTL